MKLECLGQQRLVAESPRLLDQVLDVCERLLRAAGRCQRPPCRDPGSHRLHGGARVGVARQLQGGGQGGQVAAALYRRERQTGVHGILHHVGVGIDENASERVELPQVVVQT